MCDLRFWEGGDGRRSGAMFCAGAGAADGTPSTSCRARLRVLCVVDPLGSPRSSCGDQLGYVARGWVPWETSTMRLGSARTQNGLSGNGGVQVVCLSVVVSIALAACGTSVTSVASTTASARVDPLTRIRASVGKTESAGTAHFVTNAIIEPGPGSNPPGTQNIVGIGDVSFAEPNIEVSYEPSPNTVPNTPVSRTLRIGNSVYTSTAPIGIHWVHSTVLAKNVNYLGALTPAALVNAKNPVVTVGPALIDGNETVEYSVAISGSTTTLSAPSGAEAHSTVAPFVAYVWLDAMGRIIQTRATITATETSSAGLPGSVSKTNTTTSTSTSTTTLSRFGESLHLVRPKGTG